MYKILMSFALAQVMRLVTLSRM